MLDTNLELKTHVALLEKDVTQMTMFVEKLDSAIEKLADVSSSIKELLAVHAHKLTQQSEINSELFTIIREMKEQNHREHTDLLQRIEGLEKWKYMIVGAGIIIGFLCSKIFDKLQLFT
jgi:chromosome segregation ATPase